MGRFESIGTVQPFLKLQEGVWADVFKAYDASLERNVLLKTLKPEFGYDDEFARRFEEEARLMARVQHPNVVSVLSFGKTESAVYFTAEFIEGVALNDLLHAGQLPAFLAAYILRETAAGLNAAHDQQIFHRDLKPSNILISATGEVKLTDFGMASIVETEDNPEIRGTLGYLAPELVFEETPSTASDLFALGATFYEMLTGQPAFRAQTPSETFERILHHDPVPFLAANPRIPADLIHVCSTLLEKEPERRYLECVSLIEELNAFIGSIPGFKGSQTLAEYYGDPKSYRESSPDIAQPDQEKSKLLLATDEPHTRGRIRQWVLAGVFFALAISLGILALSNRSTEGTLVELPAMSSSAISPEESASDTEINPAVSVDDPTVETLAIPDRKTEQVRFEAETPGNTLSPDTTIIQNLSDPAELAIGQLNVLCTPFCKVYVDNDSMGTAPPMLPLSLSAGIHQLSLINPNLPAYHTDIVIEPGQSDSLKVPLLDLVGILELNVFPWAEVYIDGVHRGKIPPTQTFVLTPGKHTLRLEHTELGDSSATLIVAPGEKQTRSYNLKR